MSKENPVPISGLQISLPFLSERIKEREIQIDNFCVDAVRSGVAAIALALDQGDDLIAAKSLCKHGEFQLWVMANFPKTYRTAAKYMKLAEIPKGNRSSLLKDAKSVNEAFRLLGIISPEPSNQIDAPSISIPPEVQRLNWLAEWAGKSDMDFSKWEPARREEMKTKLRPIVAIYERL